jgi:N-methylhydantoinase A
MPVRERLDYRGEALTPLNENDVRRACRRLAEEGVEAVAVAFLWSFKNPVHERRAVELARECLPGVYVCGSYQIQPEIREYWRMSTTVINAYVGPKLASYLEHLRSSLQEAGFEGQLLITQSNPGVIFPEVAMEQAVRTVLSGPACAPAAAAYVGRPLNLDDVITVDMGGTSFDVCLIKKGQPVTALESAVGGVYHMKLPLVDVRTIGSGGGSIAWLDSMKLLHMGPQSAGADPGPACYGKGGTEPTCTDADLVLGYLDPDYYLGGDMKLQVEPAKKAIQEKIADPLGMDLAEAAWAMRKLIDHQMVDGISLVSIQRGEDPRRYTLVVAGGAGAVHAADLAAALGVRRLLVPKTSSVFCALGGLIADVRHDFVESLAARTADADPEALNRGFRRMRGMGDSYLEREGVPVEDRYYLRSVDMRYKGQYHELQMPVPPSSPAGDGGVDQSVVETMVEDFHRLHESLYGYRDNVDTEMLNLRLAACGRVPIPALKEQPFAGRDAGEHQKGERQVFFPQWEGYRPVPIYDGNTLEVGNAVAGPAVVELRTTTVVVPPGANLELTQYESFLVELCD